MELDCSNDALSSRIENIMNYIEPKIGSTTFKSLTYFFILFPKIKFEFGFPFFGYTLYIVIELHQMQYFISVFTTWGEISHLGQDSKVGEMVVGMS